MQIQPVIPEHADTLTQIALAAKRHWGYPERWIEIWTAQLTFTAAFFESNEGWAAMDGETEAGFYTILVADKAASIEHLWVLPKYMGQGIGKQLFRHAVQTARERGCETLQLDADPNAVGFYERMGMHKVGERHSEVDGQERMLPIMEISL